VETRTHDKKRGVSEKLYELEILKFAYMKNLNLILATYLFKIDGETTKLLTQ
jgi:hypothetical protein